MSRFETKIAPGIHMYETMIKSNERIRLDSAESPYQVTAWVAYFSVDTYVGFFFG